ncbi:MAG: zf-HC2 domain-containing protein [Gammaproteobacteria bacterium]
MTHDDVWHALPFFVNGTLRGQPRADMESHLAACAECRAELATQTQVRDTLLREDVRQESAQTSFDQLWGRILEDEAVAEAHAGSGAPIPVPRAAANRAMKWLVAAVIVEGIGIAALGATTWSQSLSSSPDYRTLSTPESTLSGGQIRAVFAPDLRLADLQSLLSTSKLSVVGGPTEAGVYTLALEDANASVDGALAHLRGSASVRFAEPIGKPRVVER